MGCWNETCGVTQMPIMSGDPVALLLLGHERDRNPSERDDAGHCYAHDIWSPYGTPIYGRYNDYGSLEDIEEDWNTRFLIKRLKGQIIEKTVGENPYHDLAVVAADLTTENLLSLIHESRVDLAEHGVRMLPGRGAQMIKVHQRLGFMMVHRPIWDLLSSELETWRGVTTLAQIIADGDAYYGDLLSSSQSDEPRFLRRMRRREADGHFNYFADITDQTPRTCLNHYIELLEDTASAGVLATDPVVVGIIEQMARFTAFHANMQGLRKTYMPQAGKGSQNQNYDLIRKVHTACEAIMQAKEREWGEDDEDQEIEA